MQMCSYANDVGMTGELIAMRYEDSIGHGVSRYG